MSSSSRCVSVVLVAPGGSGLSGGQAKFAGLLLSRLSSPIEVVFIELPLRRLLGPIGSLGLLRRLFVSFRLLFRLLRVLLFKRVQVVHFFVACNRGSVYEKLVFALVCRLLGSRTIFNFRNSLDVWSRRWGVLERAILWRLIGLNDVILCQYRELSSYIDRHLIWRRAAVVVVGNGIDCSEFEFRMRDGETSRRILFLGAVGRRKGVDVLLRAFDILRTENPASRWRLRICGPVEDRDFEDVTLSQVDRVAPFVELIGEVRGTRRSTVFSEADIFVLPSRCEGFPNVLLEAMLSGLPVVASSVGAVPALIEHGEDGFLVPPEDPLALAQALGRLMRGSRLRGRLGACARQKVLNQFSIDIVASSYSDLYRRVASASR